MRGPQRAATKATVAALALTMAGTPVLITGLGEPAQAHLPVPVQLDVWEQQRHFAAMAPTRGVAAVQAAISVAVKPPAVKRDPARKPRPKPVAAPSKPSSSRAAKVTGFALDQVGKPYRFATSGPDSFDCSGLAKAAYSVVGISIPHQTGGIVKLGQAVNRSELAPGDLVFPSSGHVGIYIGDGRMVHAPKPGDHVRVAEIYSFWTARRLL